MIVIELENVGHRVGLFRTEDGAKQAAQEILDGYHALYAELSVDELASTEPLTTETLKWSKQWIDHHGRITDDQFLRWRRMTAVYTKRSCFTLHEIEVGP